MELETPLDMICRIIVRAREWDAQVPSNEPDEVDEDGPVSTDDEYDVLIDEKNDSVEAEIEAALDDLGEGGRDLVAGQAAAVALLDRALRQRHTRGVMQILPPLQLMESMLFELLWIGVSLLTIAIASGAVLLGETVTVSVIAAAILVLGGIALTVTAPAVPADRK